MTVKETTGRWTSKQRSIDWDKIQTHPMLKSLPQWEDMPGIRSENDGYSDFVKSIARFNVIEPILLCNNYLIDGRSRLAACLKLGIPAPYRVLSLVESDVARHIVGLNWARGSTPKHKLDPLDVAAGRNEEPGEPTHIKILQSPKNIEDLRPHEALLRMTEADSTEEELIAEHIRKYGCLFHITCHGKEILDGRLRLKICKELKIKPKIRQWTGEGGSVLRFIHLINCRRPWTQKGRSMAATIARIEGERSES